MQRIISSISSVVAIEGNFLPILGGLISEKKFFSIFSCSIKYSKYVPIFEIILLMEVFDVFFLNSEINFLTKSKLNSCPKFSFKKKISLLISNL